jgi:RNA polymerase sigma-70 factor (ECF subfamily)
LINWEDIIEKCRKGDIDAQTVAYRNAWKIIYPSIYLILKNREDAEDVMQEGFVKGFKKLNELRDNVRYVAWQKSICIREALTRVKKRKNFQILFPDVNLEKADRSEETKENWLESTYDITPQDVLTKLQLLPQGYQMVVQLHIMEGMSHVEIGEQLGIEASTCRSQYSRALAKLKNEIVGK